MWAIVPILMIICFLIGTFINKFLKIKVSLLNYILIGYIFIISFFQILATPFMILETNFDYLYYVFVIIILLISIISIIYIIYMSRNHTLLECIKSQVRDMIFQIKEDKVYWAIMIFIIIYQIILIVILQHSDADDSFYVTQINTIIERNKILDCDPSIGLSQFPFNIQYKLVSYEVLLAVISKAFNINGAVLAHSLIPIMLIPMHYLIVFNIAKKVSAKNSYLFVIFSGIFDIFSGYSIYSQGAFLIFRIWQGKSSIVNITLPLLLYIFINIFKKNNIEKSDLFLIFTILLTGLHYSTIGIYIVPISYACFVIAYFIREKNIRKFFQLCIPIICILPFVIIKFIIIISDFNTLSRLEGNPEILNYFEIIKNANGASFTFIIYLVSVIIIWKFGGRNYKYIFCIYPIIAFITFLNPLLKNIIAKVVTGSAVYWRLFWIIFVNYTICLAFIIIINKIRQKRIKIIANIMLLLILIFNGKYIFNNGDFQNKENWYKLSGETIKISDIISNKDPYSVVLAPEELSTEIRQYKANVYLAWSRTTYVMLNYRNINNDSDYQKLNSIFIRLYTQREWDKKVFGDLNYFNIKYVVLYKEQRECINDFSGFDEVLETENYVLYKVK